MTRSSTGRDAILDARIAIRSYRRQPRFTAVVLLTLALGVGATTAMFSVVNAVLLRPLPYVHPERLVALDEMYVSDVGATTNASYPDFLDWRAQADLFEAVEGYEDTNVASSGAGSSGGAVMIQGARASAGFFDLLGVRPALGSFFSPEDDAPDATTSVILSAGYWDREFGRDPRVVGRSISINGVQHVIRGVLPRGFYFVPVGEAEVWLPLGRSAETRSHRFDHWVSVIARLKPGVTTQVARSRMADVMRRLALLYPETNKTRGVTVTPLRAVGNAEIERSLIVLFGAVGLILLIACANVASLTVARSLQRGREIAIRSALGASRARLVRQLLTEQLVLAGGGCVLAAWIAATLVPLLLTRIPDSYFDQSPALREASVDLVALGFAAAIAAVTAVTFGLAPALLASRGSALDVLRSDSRVGTSRAHHRVRDAIVTAEIGMTFVILVAAVLMGRSLVALSRVDAGFAPDRVATARVALSGPQYAEGRRQQRFFEELLARLRVLPGVEAVAAISQPPLSGGGSNAFRVDGEPLPDPGARPEARMRAVAGDYFQALRIPIVEGRPLTARDDTVSAYVLVINQLLARRLFGSQSALGKRLRIYGWQDSAWTIVGVTRDVRIARLDRPAPPTIYYSHLQGPANRMTVLVRMPSESQALAALRRTINAVDPNAAIYGTVTMSELVARSPAVSSRRSLLVVFGAFAATALILALVGVYGVLAYAVTQRSRELAIRTALGATVADVVALVVRDAVRLAVAGLALGTVAALVVTRSLAALLFGITPGDVTTYAIVALLVGVVCAMASWVPARRACRVDPAITLRAD